MLCTIFFKVFWLLFELYFSFMLHPSLIFILFLFFHFFPSFFLAILSICVKKGESILESLLVSCTFIREKFHRGDAYTKREKTFFYEKTLFCFVLLYVCFLVLLYGALSLLVLCFVVLISYLYVGHAYILMLLYFIDCMFEWSFSLPSDHCSYFYMTAMCLIKLLICFTSCLLDCFLLCTLYLSFITCFSLRI